MRELRWATVSAPAASSPVLLYDGVCNLCHGAVQWILKRDRRQRFRFAALQSQAGREALAGAGFHGPPPESVVVIANGQVYQQSAAALQAAKALGFPWALLMALAIVPRPIRDAVYRWIARHRYRWFGKKDACPMPTPKTLALFLDAHEPPPESWDLSTAGPATVDAVVPRTDVLAHHGARIGLVYALLYIFPFPFTLLPKTESVWEEWTKLHQGALAWFSDTFLGLELTVFAAGSGDTTSNYVEILMRLAVALLLGSAWHFGVRRRPLSARTLDWLFLILRLYLASMLMLYGWIKAFPAQMPPPGPDRLLQPIGDASPMGLVWTFLGASPGYQTFGGISELLAGFLLLFRRTALLGALVSVAVLTNVAALNYFYDVPVKLFSTHLVLLSLLLLLPDLPRLAALLFFQLPTQPRELTPFPWRRRWQRCLVVLLFLGFLWQTSVKYARQGWDGSHTYGPYAEAGPLHGFYRVTDVQWGERSNRELEDDERWVRVGINHRWGSPSTLALGVVRADGSTARGFASLDTDNDELRLGQPIGGLSVLGIAEGAPELDEEGVFTSAPPDELLLIAEVDGTLIELRLARDEAYRSELLERGFHWVNEYPRNR